MAHSQKNPFFHLQHLVNLLLWIVKFLSNFLLSQQLIAQEILFIVMPVIRFIQRRFCFILCFLRNSQSGWFNIIWILKRKKHRCHVDSFWYGWKFNENISPKFKNIAPFIKSQQKCTKIKMNLKQITKQKQRTKHINWFNPRFISKTGNTAQGHLKPMNLHWRAACVDKNWQWFKLTHKQKWQWLVKPFNWNECVYCQ